MQNKKLGFLGILFRANKAFIGPTLDEKLLKMKLVIVATDISSSTSARMLSRIKENGIPYIKEFSVEELGFAVGRDKVNFIGISDIKAVNAYLKKGEAA